MTDRLEGECDTQTPGQTTHGRPSDESSAKSWKDSGSIGNDNSGLAGSGPKGKRIVDRRKLWASAQSKTKLATVSISKILKENGGNMPQYEIRYQIHEIRISEEGGNMPQCEYMMHNQRMNPTSSINYPQLNNNPLRSQNDVSTNASRETL
ncbi:hypothetical protein VitviT2T_002744 [Vitis vinifera]|uniref:Uncharacterized protein n=1 Tax=Vitis vinifera TaxID=29760 RepID=A0ABY9BK20_VITVI|nr:hypothetical protein VitviT2T_002744 [Vitis vinifera]